MIFEVYNSVLLGNRIYHICLTKVNIMNKDNVNSQNIMLADTYQLCVEVFSKVLENQCLAINYYCGVPESSERDWRGSDLPDRTDF